MSHNTIVDDFISTCNAKFRLLNIGQLAYLHGDLTEHLSSEQQEKLSNINYCQKNYLEHIE